MIEIDVKNELGLKVFINGFPTIENMSDTDYKLLVDELEQRLEKEIFNEQIKD